MSNAVEEAVIDEIVTEEINEENVQDEPQEDDGNAEPVPTNFPSAPFKPVNPLVVSKRWKEYLDPESNRHYYFDRVTKGVQWRKPAGFLTRKEMLRPVSTNRIGTSDWKVVNTLGGRDYFWNMVLNTVAWSLPEDFNTPVPAAPLEQKEPTVSPPPSNEAQLEKKRHSSDTLEDEAPEAKRRKLANESSKPATLVGMIEDSRELAVDNYKRMLESFGVDKDAIWSEWNLKLAKDSRFNAVVSLVERRSLFESYVRQLASQEKKRKEEAKEALRKEIRKLPSWRGFDAFKDLLRPTEAYQNLRDLDPESIGDLYDEALEMEAETRRKDRDRAKRDFLDMLDEKIRDAYERDTRKDWLDFKLQLEDDPRYNRAQLSGGDREALFEDFARDIRHELRQKTRDSRPRDRDYEDERGGGRTETQKREEALRRRNEEAMRQRQREERYSRDKSQRAREERELSSFRTLLAERVTRSDGQAWEDVADLLSRDPRFETQYLDTRGKRRLLEEHLVQLKRSTEERFFDALDRFGAGDCYQPWQKACNSLVGTPVFNIITNNADRELTYDKWAEQRRKGFEADLKRLFQETPLITKDAELDNAKDLNPILDELRKDVRWRRLPDSSPGWDSARMDLLRSFVDSLQ